MNLNESDRHEENQIFSVDRDDRFDRNGIYKYLFYIKLYRNLCIVKISYDSSDSSTCKRFFFIAEIVKDLLLKLINHD